MSDVELHDNEVRVVPGKCITWRCENDAPDGPECPEHAAELLPRIEKTRPDSRTRQERERRRREADPEYAKLALKKRRERSRLARLDPAYRERHNRRKRERRAGLPLDSTSKPEVA